MTESGLVSAARPRSGLERWLAARVSQNHGTGRVGSGLGGVNQRPAPLPSLARASLLDCET
jgi:hypothetical protein